MAVQTEMYPKSDLVLLQAIEQGHKPASKCLRRSANRLRMTLLRNERTL